MASGWYVYGIIFSYCSPPSGLVGFGGVALTAIRHGDIAAAVSPVRSDGLRPTPENILLHEQVVEALHLAMPLLPARFGTVLPGYDSVTEALAERYSALLSDLSRIGDKVELGLAVLWSSDFAKGQDSGQQPRPSRSRRPTRSALVSHGIPATGAKSKHVVPANPSPGWTMPDLEAEVEAFDSFRTSTGCVGSVVADPPWRPRGDGAATGGRGGHGGTGRPRGDRGGHGGAAPTDSKTGMICKEPSAGTRYLMGRLREYQQEALLRARAVAIARDLGNILDSRSVDSRYTVLPTSRLAVRASYLLEPSQVGDFRQAFEELRATYPDLRFLLTGPWPPYSFVTQAGAANLEAIVPGLAGRRQE